MTVFDENEFYESEILPLVKEIKRKCLLKNTTFIFVACPANNNFKTQYEIEMLSPAASDIELTQDYYSQMLLAATGVKNEYHAIPSVYETLKHQLEDEGEDDVLDINFDLSSN